MAGRSAAPRRSSPFPRWCSWDSDARAQRIGGEGAPSRRLSYKAAPNWAFKHSATASIEAERRRSISPHATQPAESVPASEIFPRRDTRASHHRTQCSLPVRTSVM
jgi:hypothetical protein